VRPESSVWDIVVSISRILVPLGQAERHGAIFATCTGIYGEVSVADEPDEPPRTLNGFFFFTIKDNLFLLEIRLNSIIKSPYPIFQRGRRKDGFFSCL
jgi:hypothetical protein